MAFHIQVKQHGDAEVLLGEHHEPDAPAAAEIQIEQKAIARGQVKQSEP